MSTDSIFEQLFNRFFPHVTFVTYEQLKEDALEDHKNETEAERYYRELEEEDPEAEDYENL